MVVVDFLIAVVDLNFFLVRFGFGLVSCSMNLDVYGLWCGACGSSLLFFDGHGDVGSDLLFWFVMFVEFVALGGWSAR